MTLQDGARWTALTALFCIPFVALVVANSFFFPFITGKGFAFRILVEIAFAGWALLALADKTYRPRFSWTLVIFGAFTLWMAVADMFAVNSHKAFWSNFERMEGWVTLIHLFMFFIAAGSILGVGKLWRRWWITFATSSALVGSYGLLQAFGAVAIHQGTTRVDSTLGNAEYFAGFLFFAIAIALWQAFETRDRSMLWLRYGLFALAAVNFFLLIKTGTRGTMIGLVGGLGFGTLLFLYESRGRARGYAAAALVALLLLVGGFYAARNSDFVQHNTALVRLASVFSLDQYKVRFTIGHIALQGALEKPIAGWGQEGFNYVFQKYYEPSMYAQEPWFDRAHNIFLDWLIAGGVPALLLFCALLLSALWAFYRQDGPRSVRIILISTLVAYLVQGLTVFDNLFTYVPLIALLAVAHTRSSRPWAWMERVPVPDEMSLMAMATPIVGVVALAALWFVNVPGITAAGDLLHALSPSSQGLAGNFAYFQKAIADNSFASQEIREQMVTLIPQVVADPNTPMEQKKQFVEYVIAQMGKEIAHTPQDARLHLEFSLGYRAAGDYEDALVQNDAALTLSPRKQSTLIDQGLIYAQTGQFDKAHEIFNRAYELDHSFLELAGYAGASDIAVGDVETGRKLLLEKLGTTTLNSQFLVIAYFQAKRYDDLVSVLELIARTDDTPDARFRLASGYVVAGRYGEARAEIQETMKKYPETATQGAQLLSKVPAGG